MIRWFFAALHLLALGLGLGAVLARAIALRGGNPSHGALRAAFTADGFWGIAAVLWLATGLFRAFGGIEKGTSYYLHNAFFHAKLGLFILVLILEAGPMMTLMRWRNALRKGTEPDLRAASRISGVSFVEAAIVVAMVLLATAMARGYGTMGGGG
jgi:putative membrane protein